MSTSARELAHARVAEHVRDAAGALGYDLDDLAPAPDRTVGDQPDVLGPPGRISIGRTWWLPAGTTTGPVFDTLARHWLARGYRLVGDGRADPLPYLWAEDPVDGYRLGVEGDVQDRLLLGACSPPLWSDRVE
jgi:hypothetical protein